MKIATNPFSPSTFCFLMLSGMLLLSCDDNDEPATPTTVIYKKDTAVLKQQSVKLKAPVINIVDTVCLPYKVLVYKDSAANSTRIGEKMAKIYDSILPAVAASKKITLNGPRMAWYRSSTAPFYFEAGIPISGTPSGKLPKNISVKQIKSDSAVVAHFFGPYDLTYQAYEAITEWMKDRQMKRSSAPFEIYVGNAVDERGRAVDPYKVQTDIVFPH